MKYSHFQNDAMKQKYLNDCWTYDKMNLNYDGNVLNNELKLLWTLSFTIFHFGRHFQQAVVLPYFVQ